MSADFEVMMSTANTEQSVTLEQTPTVEIVTAQWGNITGTMSNQSDLNTALADKASRSYVTPLYTMISSKASRSSVTALEAAKADADSLALLARRVDALYKVNEGQTYDFDVDTADCYSASVPSGSVADSVTKIGGKSIVMNQLVDSATTTVTLVTGHKYFTDISDVQSIQTGAGSTVSVTGGTDMVVDLTQMFGSGNEPSTAAEFKAMFPNDYYAYNTGSIVSAGVKQVVVKDDDDATTSTTAIPSTVQALTGYGWSAGTAYNYVDYADKKYYQCVGSRAYESGDEDVSTYLTDGTTTYYPLATPVVTDVSDLLDDGFLEALACEGGGSVSFVSDTTDAYRLPVPNTNEFVVRLSDA